ncbi:hypothetical protein QC762_704420 [Podospora pseudocomata]|uniref:Transcription factor hoxa13 n=1 Tax=Podospora pseudocomata TaxID=2093779 RepID=A0ABR0G2C1_9PEZI|nr:hypothetical protein QC762_704420 [Podospora pseudocomata]
MDDINGTTMKAHRAANGINGAIKSPALNGHNTVQKRITRSRGPGWPSWLFSFAARLVAWYSIYAILFWCPATLDACDENSPLVCRPYFQLKNTVTPHLEPYYDAYAAPYVELARPYYNAVDEKVITPAWGYAKQHGAPQVEQARVYGKAQWEKSVQPQITKVQHLAKTQYDHTLAPHLDQLSAAVGPYYEIVRTNSLQTYHEFLLPSYQFAQPYALQAYHATSDFALGTVAPTCAWAWNKTNLFLDSTVWPHLRVIYVENVEPQLVKIGKRLGRYSSSTNGTKKSVPKSAVDSASSFASKTISSFVKPAPSASSTTSVVASSKSSSTAGRPQAKDAPEAHRSKSSVDPITPPDTAEQVENEDPVRRAARETVAADLKDWQERYAKAVDEGAAEIDNRVQEISKRMIRRNARITGKALLDQLQEATVSELVLLRGDILDIINAVNDKELGTEDAQEEIVQAVRQAGMAIKDKAQAVRHWREEYETELQASITQAAETHFTVLQGIRDLALQRIGMKWAWTDGITYKDWAKYHLLKSRFDEWKGDLEKLIVTHPNLEAAQVEGANIEDEAMKLAATAAKELGRLKQVANWKLVAGDVTEEFDSTLTQQAAEAVEAARLAATSVVNKAGESAEKAQHAVVDKVAGAYEKASEAVVGVTDTVSEKTAEAAQSVGNNNLWAEDSMAGEGDEEPAEAISAASEEISSVVEPTSEATADVDNSPEPVADDLAHLAASESLVFETPPIVDNVTQIQEDVKADPAPVELPVDEDAAGEEEEAGDAPDTRPVAEAEAGPTVKPALFGAAAQVVPRHSPILDDEEDDEEDMSGAIQVMQDELRSVYSAAMSRANAQYSEALSAVSAQIHGTPLPAHQQMLASVTSAYNKAMASASSRMDVALEAVSTQLRGTPTKTKKNIMPTVAIPTVPVPSVDWARIESIASERLEQGRSWALEQYESAKIAAGLATPTPSTPAEHVNKLLDNARHNYYAGLGLAHARYSEFLSAASAAVSSMTATPTPTDLAGTASSLASVASESAAAAAAAVGESASSAASVASESAASAASAASVAAASAASAASESGASAASVIGSGASSIAAAASAGVSSAASVAGENISSAAAAGYEQAGAAADYVADGWDVIVTKISIQVYGAPAPTPWYEAFYSGVGEYASSASAAAGEGAGSVTSAAAVASDAAAQRYEAVSALVSELLVGKEPTFSESVVSRLNAAYATGTNVVGSAASAANEVVGEAGEKVRSVGEKVASVASEATEAVKEKVQGHDEL